MVEQMLKLVHCKSNAFSAQQLTVLQEHCVAWTGDSNKVCVEGAESKVQPVTQNSGSMFESCILALHMLVRNCRGGSHFWIKSITVTMVCFT